MHLPFYIACALPFFLAVITAPLVFKYFARASGWAHLAERYQCHALFEGTRYRFESIHWSGMNLFGMNYGGIVTFGTNSNGLYICLFFIFRPFHPPLLIPWSDIRRRQYKKFLRNAYELTFPSMPKITMQVSKRIYDQTEGRCQVEG